MPAINSRRITDLDPEVALVCNAHILACYRAGIELLITSTYRNYQAQDELFAIGRTVHPERRPVTNAKAGQSFHNFRSAWDVVPLIGGKCDWKSRYPNGKLTPTWAEVVQLGKTAGALAGADWTGKLIDDAHFYVAPTVEGLHISLDEARARFDANGTIFTA